MQFISQGLYTVNTTSILRLISALLLEEFWDDQGIFTTVAFENVCRKRHGKHGTGREGLAGGNGKRGG